MKNVTLPLWQQSQTVCSSTMHAGFCGLASTIVATITISCTVLVFPAHLFFRIHIHNLHSYSFRPFFLQLCQSSLSLALTLFCSLYNYTTLMSPQIDLIGQQLYIRIYRILAYSPRHAQFFKLFFSFFICSRK